MRSPERAGPRSDDRSFKGSAWSARGRDVISAASDAWRRVVKEACEAAGNCVIPADVERRDARLSECVRHAQMHLSLARAFFSGEAVVKPDHAHPALDPNARPVSNGENPRGISV